MEKVNTVYLSIGSNLGDRFQNIQNALNQLKIQLGEIKLVSSIYESEAIGFDSEDSFFNICTIVSTTKSPMETLITTQSIEKGLGRAKKTIEGYESRIIDIDIVFFNELIIKNEKLIIPHPHYTNRKFVLVPMSEIADNKVDPEMNENILAITQKCDDKSELKLLVKSLNY